MYKLLTLVFLSVTAMCILPSCKKCYNCYNDCVQCSITVGSNSFSQVLCSDSFDNQANYQAAITASQSAGYTCSKTESTYSFNYCISKDGDEFYQNYFNKNKRVTCDEK